MEENKHGTCRNSSRKDWTSKGTNEDINSGSFQRIADALERANLKNDELLRVVSSILETNRKKLSSMNTKMSYLKRRIDMLEKKLKD